jgi:Ca-activated chloride channel family protein
MKSLRMARAVPTVLLMTCALTVQAAPVAAPSTPAPAETEAPAASLWSRMWRTPDQRGQALLQQGDAAGAAKAFADPLHKGHAALQAHDYAGAAKTLSGIDTAEAQYNRGNALAHSGDLQGAIDAYDAAIKHDPQHTDARHNRDVVAAALKKQKSEKKDSSKQDKQENEKKKNKDDNQTSDKRDGKPDAKPSDGKDDKPGDKQGDKSQPKPNEGPSKKPDDKPGQTPPAKPGQQPASAPQAGGASAPAAPASSPKDDAAQARRDAESSLGKGVQPPSQPQNGASAPAPGQPGSSDLVKQPQTEKQIAQEQWLRAIPDDPGGLLRRKFLIEHMLRQQGQKP